MTDKMYEVSYDGKIIGLVRANESSVGKQVESLLALATANESNSLYGIEIDRSKLAWSDANHEKYGHMMG